MKISKEIVPFEWLQSESWECTDLADSIAAHSCEEAFNSYVEEYFNGQIPSETELNDFCRFNYDEICESLGIEEE